MTAHPDGEHHCLDCGALADGDLCVEHAAQQLPEAARWDDIDDDD